MRPTLQERLVSAGVELVQADRAYWDLAREMHALKCRRADPYAEIPACRDYFGEGPEPRYCRACIKWMGLKERRAIVYYFRKLAKRRMYRAVARLEDRGVIIRKAAPDF